MVTKAQMIEAIQSLPEDATVEDAMQRLHVLAKIEIGLAQLDAGRGRPREEMRRQIAEWREYPGGRRRATPCARSPAMLPASLSATLICSSIASSNPWSGS